MYVCQYVPKIKCQFRQNGRIFFFFHKTEWVNVVLRILTLEGQQNCMIGSKVKTILPRFFHKIQELQTYACGLFFQMKIT